MPLTVNQVTKEALALPNGTRVRLVEKLVESLEADENRETRSSWLDKAKQRRDEIRHGKVKPVESKRVLKEVRRLVSR